jgi:hypothetical protein
MNVTDHGKYLMGILIHSPYQIGDRVYLHRNKEDAWHICEILIDEIIKELVSLELFSRAEHYIELKSEIWKLYMKTETND